MQMQVTGDKDRSWVIGYRGAACGRSMASRKENDMGEKIILVVLIRPLVVVLLSGQRYI